MHVGVGGTYKLMQDLHLLTTEPDLIRFINVLHAMPEVVEIKIYKTFELPDLPRTKIEASALNLFNLEKIK